MTTLQTRNGLTRLTLSSVFTASALGAVLIAFACGDNGTSNTPPNTTPDLATPPSDPPDMASPPLPGAPTLSSVTPKLVSTAGGTSVTLTGTNFRAGATVKLGTVTVPASDVTVGVDGNSIIIKVPARLGMPGKVDVTVTNTDTLSVTSTGALTYYLGQASFGTPRSIVTDRGTRCIVVTDLNADMKADLVTANFDANTVSVLMGDNTGKFTNTGNIGVGTKPYTVAVGLLDSDTKLDLVTANQGGGSISVLSGDGTGKFAMPATNTIGLGNSPQSVVILDANNDGTLDLVVNNAGQANNNLSVLIGNKSTTFTSAGTQMMTVNGNMLYSLIADDFNKDGKLDIVGVHQSTAAINVSPLLNKGGTGAPYFTVGTNKSASSTPTAAAAGDFDNDGNKDLAVVNQVGNNVSFLKGSATGTFTDTVANSPTPVGTGPEHLAAIDVNMDGNLDLVVANYTAGNLSVLLGKGDGTFATAMTVNVGTIKPNWVAVGDFNGDGRADLAVADYNTASGQVMILLNTSQ